MLKKKVLFLCTGNSCRSHMAQGLTNYFLGEKWEAISAGTVPTHYVHPLAINVLAELGIDISHHTSKSMEVFREADLELVVTVCNDAAENCPLWLDQGKVVHISFSDPAKAKGTVEEITAVFRQVRDDIRERVLGYLEEY
jgi:arsenate reductase (thioredoxin)